MAKALACAAGIGMAIVTVGGSAWGAVSFQSIARQGRDGMDSVGYPSINNQGQIAFCARSGLQTGFWIYQSGVTQAKVLENHPTTNGLQLGWMSANTGSCVIEDDGTLGFSGYLKGAGIVGGVNDWADFTLSPAGDLRVMVQKNAAHPALPGGVTVTDYQFGGLNHGQYIAWGSLNTGGQAVFTGRYDQPLSIIQNGDATGSGTNLRTLTRYTNISSDGTVHLDSALDIDGNGGILFKGTPGNLEKIYGNGDPVPGKPGLTFNSPHANGYNSQGQSVHGTTLLGAGGGYSYFMFDSDGSYKPLLIHGQAAPDLPGQVIDIAGNVECLINGNGQVAMVASYAPNTASPMTAVGIFTGTAGDLHLVAHTGAVAGDTSTTIVGMEINAKGQIVYRALDTKTSRMSIWAWDATAGLQFLAGDGMSITVDGVNETIRYASPVLQSGGDDGMLRSLSDDGTFVMRVVYSDGSADIISTQVPEPGTASFVGLATLACLLRRSRG